MWVFVEWRRAWVKQKARSALATFRVVSRLLVVGARAAFWREGTVPRGRARGRLHFFPFEATPHPASLLLVLWAGTPRSRFPPLRWEISHESPLEISFEVHVRGVLAVPPGNGRYRSAWFFSAERSPPGPPWTF